MGKLEKRIKDRRLLKLIRKYLESGVLINGSKVSSEEGIPQGGSLNPLLANVMLDDVDKELEKRGHKFCRYADDCNIYVRSKRAGLRVMESITRIIEGRLKLKVNRDKSAVEANAATVSLKGASNYANASMVVDASYRGQDGAVSNGYKAYKTVQAAINSVSQYNKSEVIIYIKNGTYHEKLTVNKPNITLIGQDQKKQY